MHVRNGFEDLFVNEAGVAFVVLAHICDRVENFLSGNELHDLVDFVFEFVFEDFDCANYILMFKLAHYLKLVFVCSQLLVVVVSNYLDCVPLDRRIKSRTLNNARLRQRFCGIT